eukprot:gene3199-3952_t
MNIWTVDNRIKLAIFATKDLDAGTELTFDYRWGLSERDPTRCYCGAENCRGYIEIMTPDELDAVFYAKRGQWRSSSDLDLDAILTNNSFKLDEVKRKDALQEEKIDANVYSSGDPWQVDMDMDPSVVDKREVESPRRDGAVDEEGSVSFKSALSPIMSSDHNLELLRASTTDRFVTTALTDHATTQATLSHSPAVVDPTLGTAPRRTAIPPSWFISKRLRIYWEGNDCYFEADVLRVNEETGTVTVYYFADEMECEEVLEVGGKWEWLDQTKEDRQIKRKRRPASPVTDTTTEDASSNTSSSTFQFEPPAPASSSNLPGPVYPDTVMRFKRCKRAPPTEYQIPFSLAALLAGYPLLPEEEVLLPPTAVWGELEKFLARIMGWDYFSFTPEDENKQCSVTVTVFTYDEWRKSLFKALMDDGYVYLRDVFIPKAYRAILRTQPAVLIQDWRLAPTPNNDVERSALIQLHSNLLTSPLQSRYWLPGPTCSLPHPVEALAPLLSRLEECLNKLELTLSVRLYAITLAIRVLQRDPSAGTTRYTIPRDRIAVVGALLLITVK